METIGNEEYEAEARFKRIVEFSKIPAITHMTMRLFNFLPLKGTEEAYLAALKFISNREHPFLTLAGKAGRGKTHLALGIGWHWLEVKNELVMYSQVGSLLDELRGCYEAREGDDASYFSTKLNQYQKCSLLILDDLGVEQSTEWAREKLDEIIDYRYINKLPLVVTTNLSPEKLEPRIAGRLREGVCVYLECGNYRDIIARQRKEQKVD